MLLRKLVWFVAAFNSFSIAQFACIKLQYLVITLKGHLFINVGYQVLIVRTEPMDLSVNRELVVASNRFSKLEYVSHS